MKETAAVLRRSPPISDQIYELVRSRIVSGDFAADKPLSERALARLFGASPTPVREALKRLEQERLVVRTFNGGVRVRQISPQEFIDLLEVREQLEGFAAEQAARNPSPQSVSTLEKVIQLSAELVESAEFSSYRDLDLKFHRLIVSMSQNETLSHIMSSLQDQIQLVMLTTVMLPGRGPHTSLEEHFRIFDAIKCENARLARNSAEEHVRDVKNAYLCVLATQD